MPTRRQLLQLAGVAAVAGVGGAAWVAYGQRRSGALGGVGSAPFKNYPFDPVAPANSSWKDTVLVRPGETVRIALDFSHDFPGDQTSVFHCHNLEHEDAGMMINFRVQA